MNYRIGIDLDNTIINYDRLFARVADDYGYVIGKSAVSKRQVRDTVRHLPDGEAKWQRLQKAVYKDRICEARIFRGAALCIKSLIRSGSRVLIISHKTPEFREAAMIFLRSRLPFISDRSIFFESSRQEKIGRIKSLKCDYMIDDLIEVFIDSAYPRNVRKLLFRPARKFPVPCDITVFRSWDKISRYFSETNMI